MIDGERITPEFWAIYVSQLEVCSLRATVDRLALINTYFQEFQMQLKESDHLGSDLSMADAVFKVIVPEYALRCRTEGAVT